MMVCSGRRRWPVMAAAGLALAGCSSSSTSSASSQAGVVTTTPAAATTAAPTTSDTSGLSGFGANRAPWDAAHVADTRFAAGSTYDADPRLGESERFDDAYYAVLHDQGRVSGYQQRFPRGTTVRKALAAVRQQDMPADATVVWQRELDTCYQVQFRSATLDKVFSVDPSGLGKFKQKISGDPDGGHAGPLVELNSDEVTRGGNGYDRSDVVGAYVNILYASAPRYDSGC